MNRRRIILGGLLAGLVLSIGEGFVNRPLLGDAWENVMVSLGLPAQPPLPVLGIFAALVFGLGILMVWLYAAIRSRFGPGPRTALKAGAVVWLLTAGWGLGTQYLLGLYPGRLVLATLALGLVEFALASLAGAWIYRE